MTTITKKVLYGMVDKMRNSLGICNYPINAKELATTMFDISVVEIDVDEKRFCAALKKNRTSGRIVFNSNRSPQMQNFDCMHELIHYCFHKGDSFYCVDGSVDQDPFLEWQANEGAAQSLVPYQLFIPDYIELSRKYADLSFSQDEAINNCLAQKYNVTTDVISVRRASLSYEISQYMAGIPIRKIQLLSKREISKRGLEGKCKHEKAYCMNCHTSLGSGNYCTTCGMYVGESANPSLVWAGDGYIHYSRYKVRADGCASECPCCGANNASSTDKECRQCGFALQNICSDDPNYHFLGSACHAISDPNNRHCPQCGKPTLFYELGFLKHWRQSFHN